MAAQWGRRETVVWPPHSPVYSYLAVLTALLLTGVFMWCHFTFASDPLQQYYTPIYFRTGLGASFQKAEKFRLLWIGDGKRFGRLATLPDTVKGWTLNPDGTDLPLAPSADALARGLKALYRGPELSYDDKRLNAFLQASVFEGNTLASIYEETWLAGLGAFALLLCVSIPKDIARRKMLKYGRRLKGPVMMSPSEFNKEVQGQGIGFQTLEAKERMCIPASAEAQHIQIIGDTGSGKSTLIRMMLGQIRDRGESAIIYDPACEFVRRFYDEGRGDIILNPLDDRCPYWGPSEELRRKAEAKAIAASLYQPTNDKKGEFFTETPQKIFAHLLTFGPTPQQLVEWMSNPDEIDKRVKGTELASILTPGAQQQRAGVLASLGLIADSLRMLPTKEQAERTWSATDWAEKREGWIFITSKAAEREALRPLHSLWIDLLVLRLLNTPEQNQRKVWFVLDELASLQRLPQLHTAITENRKSANPLVLGFQGKAQLEVIYGHMAEVMLSQPATKIFLKTTEPKAAEWVSKAIGQVEIERMKESHHSGQRAGKNFTLDRQIEPLVMDSEISGLADKHAFLKLGNRVARFSFAYVDAPETTPDFVARKIADDELSFDPKTLQPTAPRKNTDKGKDAAFPQPYISAPPVTEKTKRKKAAKPQPVVLPLATHESEPASLEDEVEIEPEAPRAVMTPAPESIHSEVL